MEPVIVALAVAVVGTAVLLVLMLAGRWRRRGFDAVLPRELRGLRSWGRERAVACAGPVPLAGRLDESYEGPDGTVHLAEIKTRAQPVVHASDVLQLSAYKYAIERSARPAPVAAQGYVRLIDARGASVYRRVALLPAAEVEAAALRYDDLRQQRDRGRPCGHAVVCRRCAYQDVCDDD